MAAPKQASSPLVAAAQAFEDELTQLDDLANQLERASITTEKALKRSATLLEQATTAHDRLSERLAGLVSAIDGTRKRQELALGRVLVETRRVEQRSRGYRAVMERFADLGVQAQALQGPLETVSARQASEERPDAVLESLGAVEALIVGVLENADAVAKAAEEGDWPEVAREAQALRQTMHSAKNKVALARRAVAGRAPS